MAESVGEVRRGAAWSYAGQLYLTIGHFVLGVVLARLLGPDEFGVFIAVTAFTSLMLIAANFGLPQALLQAKTLSREQIDAAFWTMVVLALAMLAMLVLIAGPLTTVYDAPEFRGVMLAMGGILLLTPYTALGFALLRRQMRFDRVARIDMLAFNVSAFAGVVSALAGAEVYSLVVGAITAMLVNTLSIARAEPWRPRLPRLAPVRSLLRYAGFVTVNNFIGVSASRVDNMVLGAVLGTGPLGPYNRAYSLARIPSDQFAESIGPLLLRSLARVQDDPVRTRTLYFKAVAAITALTLPLLVLLGVAGPVAIDFLYGAAWSSAGAPLQVMVIGAAFLVLGVNMRVLINALGLVRELVRINLILLAATVLSVAVLAPFGLVAVAAGISAREALMLLLTARLLRRSRLRLRLAEVVHAAAPSFIAAAVSLPAGLSALILARGPAETNSLLVLVVVAIVIFATYGLVLGGLIAFWRSHAPLASLRDILVEAAGLLRCRISRLRPAADQPRGRSPNRSRPTGVETSSTAAPAAGDPGSAELR
jgi:PST family polysaccharide transporter